jgi:hypothetical protein
LHSSSTTVKLLPKGSANYAQLICANCGEGLRFLPKRENIEKWQRNAMLLERLQKIGELGFLDSWERSFIDSLAEAGRPGKLSPAQQATFDKIVAIYLARIGERLQAGKGAK